MSLPSYKINNSYTVYVNYFYLNECIKAGKKNTSKKPTSSPLPQKARSTPKPAVQPLAANTLLRHKRYGTGKVVSTDKDGIMRVAFDTKVLHFIYPDTVRKGYLSVIKK